MIQEPGGEQRNRLGAVAFSPLARIVEVDSKLDHAGWQALAHAHAGLDITDQVAVGLDGEVEGPAHPLPRGEHSLPQLAAPSRSGWERRRLGRRAALPDGCLVRRPESPQVDVLSVEARNLGGIGGHGAGFSADR